ncbi:hypothetical protein [Pseudomonas sp. CGJS7]|uniref:hypothetical protein n=1 Tax=Pseudomonas sp. CGJS7 TaxID=3109348 RepID=UPI0030093128
MTAIIATRASDNYPLLALHCEVRRDIADRAGSHVQQRASLRWASCEKPLVFRYFWARKMSKYRKQNV